MSVKWNQVLLLSVICLFSTSLYCFHMSTGSTTVSFRQYYKVMTSSRFSFSSSSLKISYSLLISIVWPWPAPSFGNMKYLIPFCLRAKSKFFWKISLWIYENRDLPVITVQKKLQIALPENSFYVPSWENHPRKSPDT